MLDRTIEVQKEYTEYLLKMPNIIDSINESEIVFETKYWKVIKNKFPYNVSVHNLLFPKRVVKNKQDLNQEELLELNEIKDMQSSFYDTYLQHTSRNRTIPDWYHEHLLIW